MKNVNVLNEKYLEMASGGNSLPEWLTDELGRTRRVTEQIKVTTSSDDEMIILPPRAN